MAGSAKMTLRTSNTNPWATKLLQQVRSTESKDLHDSGGDVEVVPPEPRLQWLRQAGAGAREGLADFFSDWFGALRLHHKARETLIS